MGIHGVSRKDPPDPLSNRGEGQFDKVEVDTNNNWTTTHVIDSHRNSKESFGLVAG